LQALCGKDAWLNLETANELRHDAPVMAFPTNWDVPGALQRATSPPTSPADQAYMAKWGVNPQAVHSKGSPVWSAWYDVTDPRWMAVIHIAFLVCMFLFTIGFCTRVTAVLTWLGAISYIQRAGTTLFGQDTMMNIALVYLMISP